MALRLARIVSTTIALTIVANVCEASDPGVVKPEAARVAPAFSAAAQARAQIKPPLVAAQGGASKQLFSAEPPQEWCLCALSREETIFLKQYGFQ